MNKLCLALGIAVLGCGTDDPSGPEVLPELTVPAVPDNGLQVLTPIFDNIQPGTDVETCVWTDVILDKETDVKSTVAYQTEPPGHHAILFYTLDKQPPGTSRECTDADMASFRFLTGGGTTGDEYAAPGDLVFRVPAGAQLVVNAHYLNASDEVLRGQTLINVNFAEPGNHTPSGAIAILDTSIDVQPGMSSLSTSCVADRDLKFWYLIPHMHRWGDHINVDLTRNGGATENLFDTKWEEQFTFHPPESRFDPASPYIMKAGDRMDITCTWNNVEDHSLPFGFEMCVVFGQVIDEEGAGSWACNRGEWDTF